MGSRMGGVGCEGWGGVYSYVLELSPLEVTELNIWVSLMMSKATCCLVTMV
jgi:hypothetical protein